MSDLRQAAEAALDTLEFAYRDRHDGDFNPRHLKHAADNLRAALAQPEQLVVGDDLPTLTKWTPMAEYPPQRKPLTDELINVLASAMVKGDKSVNWLCRAIEKAHGIGGEHD